MGRTLELDRVFTFSATSPISIDSLIS